MTTRTTAVIVLLGATALLSQACGGDRSEGSSSVLASPTAPSAAISVTGPGSTTSNGATATSTGTAKTAAGSTTPTTTGASLRLPDEATSGTMAVVFPPRNEAFDFRANFLEQKYRGSLGRQPGNSYADVEGAIVWTTEYLRYRLGECAHEDAVNRVFDQIEGRPAAPLCGSGTAAFPPRDESLNFRLRLEDKYKNGLGRQPTSTAVDNEGDVVWTQEYLRYRTSGCSQGETIQKIDDQISGKGVQPTCWTGGQPYGPPRSIGINEAFGILLDYHNGSGVDLGRNSTREDRVAWFFSAVAIIHYGHPKYNPGGGDSGWCVKDAGGGRPPSDDVIVRCDNRDYWDVIGGAGANGYSFGLTYHGRLPSDQNVYPPPLSSLPR